MVTYIHPNGFHSIRFRLSSHYHRSIIPCPFTFCDLWHRLNHWIVHFIIHCPFSIICQIRILAHVSSHPHCVVSCCASISVSCSLVVSLHFAPSRGMPRLHALLPQKSHNTPPQCLALYLSPFMDCTSSHGTNCQSLTSHYYQSFPWCQCFI